MISSHKFCLALIACVAATAAGCRPKSVAKVARPTPSTVVERAHSTTIKPAASRRVGALLRVVEEGAVPRDVAPPATAAPAPQTVEHRIPERDLILARLWFDLAQPEGDASLDRRRELYIRLAQQTSQQASQQPPPQKETRK